MQNNNLPADARNVDLGNRNGDANVNNNNNDNVINHNNRNNANENDEEGDGLRRRVVADAPATQRVAEETNSTQRTAESAATAVSERPSPLAVTLLAIRTFFLSMVPDHPLL